MSSFVWSIEEVQGIYLVLFFFFFSIKPATPFAKMYSVFRCSNFNDIGGKANQFWEACLSAVFLYWLARLKSGFLLFRDKSSDRDFKKKIKNRRILGKRRK